MTVVERMQALEQSIAALDARLRMIQASLLTIRNYTTDPRARAEVVGMLLAMREPMQFLPFEFPCSHDGESTCVCRQVTETRMRDRMRRLFLDMPDVASRSEALEAFKTGRWPIAPSEEAGDEGGDEIGVSTPDNENAKVAIEAVVAVVESAIEGDPNQRVKVQGEGSSESVEDHKE